MDSENDLYQSLRNNEPEALNYFYRHYRHWLMVTALGMVKDEEDAEDIVQDFCLDVYQKQLFSRMEATNEKKMRSYIYRILRNRCLDHLTSKYIEQRQQEQLVLDEATYEDHLQFQNMRRYLETILDKLTPAQSQVLRLAYLEQMNRQEIADALQLSPNTVKNHLTSGTKILRKKLRNQRYDR